MPLTPFPSFPPYIPSHFFPFPFLLLLLFIFRLLSQASIRRLTEELSVAEEKRMQLLTRQAAAPVTMPTAAATAPVPNETGMDTTLPAADSDEPDTSNANASSAALSAGEAEQRIQTLEETLRHQREANEELADLARAAEQRAKDAAAQTAASDAARSTAETTLTALREDMSATKQRLASLGEEHAAALAQAEAKYRKKQEALTAVQAERDNLVSQHDAALAALRAEHASALQAAAEAHDTALSETEARCAAAQVGLARGVVETKEVFGKPGAERKV